MSTNVVLRNANGSAAYAPGTFAASQSPTDGQTTTYPSSSNSNSGSTSQVGRYPDQTGTIDLVKNAAPEDPSTIAARISDEYATEVAAIKSNAADQLTKQATTNTDNEGRSRATSAATGTLGGAMGDRSQALSEEASEQANQGITDSEESKLATISSAVNSQAETENQSEKTAYSTALSNKISSTQSMIQSMAATSDLSSLSQDEYDSLYASAGFDTPDEFNAYYTAARQAAQLGTKLVGDADTGYYLPKIGANGVVSYTNVIKPKPTAGSAYGTYQYDPTTESVTTVSPGSTSKVITSGGRLWLVPMTNGSPTGGAATPLTPAKAGVTGKVGWGMSSDPSIDIAAQQAVESAYGDSGPDYEAAMAKIQSDPDAFLTAVNQAYSDGIYSPTVLSGQDDSAAISAADAAESSAQDAEDDADNNADDSNSQ